MHQRLAQVGHGVSLIKNLLKEHKSSETYRLATTVAQKWYRLVFKKSASHAHQDGEHPPHLESEPPSPDLKDGPREGAPVP